MKPETRLAKIMKLEDGYRKTFELWMFCCRHTQVGSNNWKAAKAEYDRLVQVGYRA